MSDIKFWLNKSPKSKFYKITNTDFIPFMKSTLDCLRCGNEVKRVYGSWMAQCSRCKALISFFAPTPIQQIAGKSENMIIINVGGVGSGKTTISCNIFSSMMRSIPGARMIVCAQTLTQLEKNGLSELIQFFHHSEIKVKRKDSWELVNGGKIEFWPSDDPDKLKSANVNFIWLIEANTPGMQLMFNESLARIRNQKGLVYEKDENGEIILERRANNQIRPKVAYSKNLIIAEANPEHGAWTNKVILTAHTVIHTQTVKGIPLVKAQTKPSRHHNSLSGRDENVDILGILNATVDNPILPDSYFTNLRARCRTQEEFDRIIYCDITSQDGLVFKDLVENPSKYFEEIHQFNLMNPNLVFIEGLDPGGSNVANDPEAYLFFTFDTQFKKLTLIDGFKISGLSLEQSTKKIWDIRTKWGWTRDKFFAFIADNALGKSSKMDNKFSLKTDYEVRLTVPITLQNDKSIATGIRKLSSWFNAGTITINNSFVEVKQELFGYEKYEEMKVTKGNQIKYTEKYTEVNNHTIDVLRYVVTALEGYGYRQDQAMIEYNQALSFQGVPGRMKPYGFDKQDIQQFLPPLFGGPEEEIERKKIKF